MLEHPGVAMVWGGIMGGLSLVLISPWGRQYPFQGNVYQQPVSSKLNFVILCHGHKNKLSIENLNY